MRDILIHGYFGIDLELTWEVVKKDIPDFKEKDSQNQGRIGFRY